MNSSSHQTIDSRHVGRHSHTQCTKLDSSDWTKRLSLSLVTAAILSGCGGGDPAPAPPVPVGPTPTLVASCYSGGVANNVGVDDPFYVNAWHLKNTGPTQVVSALANEGVAGFDANVENVHKGGRGCTGRGVTIAIVDSGLEIGHEDLANNILAGKSFNFATNTDDPSPPLDEDESDHGTSVAGVAAARGWNGKGSRGTAPFASLVGYAGVGTASAMGVSEGTMIYLSFGSAALADTTQAVVAMFSNRSSVASVFNFSAGFDYGAPAIVDDFSSLELAAKYGTSNLRGGLGAVYFQAAGNEQSSMAYGRLPDGSTIPIDCATTLSEDAALLRGRITNASALTCGSPNHEPAGKPYFYQVAAIHNTGRASSYSSSGASNWITGFGGEYGTDDAAIISTDNTSCHSGTNNIANKTNLIEELGALVTRLIADLFGDPGSKDPDCNYTGQMNGTSAAAPSVAGVAALLLEANPRLTWQDVGYIMAKTARKVDPTIASAGRAVTFTPTGGQAHELDEPWITNQAGFNFQNQYGFGLIDADAATRLAVSYTIPGGRRTSALVATGRDAATKTFNGVGVNQASVNFANAGATSGQLQLDLTVTNNTGVAINPGQLQFEITNKATGTKSILLPAFTAWYVGGKNFKINAGAQQQFRMSTNAFYGENMAGDYLVSVIDFSGASGAAGKTLAFAPKLTSFSM